MTPKRNQSNGTTIATGTTPLPAAGTGGLILLPPQPGARLPELRDIVAEASCALALLDIVRLEDLALACQRFNRDLPSSSPEADIDLAQQAREASGDMAVFARVLEATRANLAVMHRLRDLREGRFEYGCPESIHGNY